MGPWKAPTGTNTKVTSAKDHFCAYWDGIPPRSGAGKKRVLSDFVRGKVDSLITPPPPGSYSWDCDCETPCEHPQPRYNKKTQDNVETNVTDAHITSLRICWSLVSEWSGVGVGVCTGAVRLYRNRDNISVIYIYIYIYMYTHICVCLYLHLSLSLYIYIYIYIYIFISL